MGNVCGLGLCMCVWTMDGVYICFVVNDKAQKTNGTLYSGYHLLISTNVH